MRTPQTTSTITCANCGAIGTGKFCSECGTELSGKPQNAYLLFADSFFKISDIRKYVSLYISILSSPVKNTIETFEKNTLRDALRFLEYSVAISSTLIISEVIIINNNDIITGVVTLLYFFISLSTSLYLHYRFVSGRARIRRSLDSFIEFSAIFLGFYLPIQAFFRFIGLIIPMVGDLFFFWVMIALYVYFVTTWKYFWGLSGWVVLGYFLLSHMLGFMVGAAFLILVSSIFDNVNFILQDFY